MYFDLKDIIKESKVGLDEGIEIGFSGKDFSFKKFRYEGENIILVFKKNDNEVEISLNNNRLKESIKIDENIECEVTEIEELVEESGNNLYTDIDEFVDEVIDEENKNPINEEININKSELEEIIDESLKNENDELVETKEYNFNIIEQYQSQIAKTYSENNLEENKEFLEEIVEEDIVHENLKIQIEEASYNILTKVMIIRFNEPIDKNILEKDFFDIFDISLLEYDDELLKFMSKVKDIKQGKVNTEFEIRFESSQSLDLSRKISIKFNKEHMEKQYNYLVSDDKLEVEFEKYYIKKEHHIMKSIFGLDMKKIVEEINFNCNVNEFKICFEDMPMNFIYKALTVSKEQDKYFVAIGNEKVEFEDTEEKYEGYIGFKEAKINLELPTGIKKQLNLYFKFLEHAVIAIWDENSFSDEFINYMKIKDVMSISVG